MLILPIKKLWFDMILSGEKLEEYREIKTYYKTRFFNKGFLDSEGNPTDRQELLTKIVYTSKDVKVFI